MKKSVAGMATAWIIGCSSPSARTNACPRPVPAFRVEVTAANDGLPPDTTMTVLYGGNQSGTYSIATGTSTSGDICCHTGTPVSGALPPVVCGSEAPTDGGDARALLCELWTNGVAEVKITAAGYSPFDDVLPAEVTDPSCGVTTLDERLVLTHGDGGL